MCETKESRIRIICGRFLFDLVLNYFLSTVSNVYIVNKGVIINTWRENAWRDVALFISLTTGKGGCTCGSARLVLAFCVHVFHKSLWR